MSLAMRIVSEADPRPFQRRSPQNKRKPFASSEAVYGKEALRVLAKDDDRSFWLFMTAVLKGNYVTPDYRISIQNEIEPMLPPDGPILDLMSDVYSCVQRRPGRITHGVGLNASLLSQNAALDGYQEYDLNAAPYFSSQILYRAAVISFGLPYLTSPLEVLRSVAGCLAPGSSIITICSILHNDEKGTALWGNAEKYNVFNRIRLAEDYLRHAGYEDVYSGELSCPVSPELAPFRNFFASIFSTGITAQ